MKSIKVISIIFFAFALIAGCGKNENKTSGNKTDEQNKEVKSSGEQNQNSSQEEFTEIKLPTMQCGTCKKNIETAVKKLDGIKDINVVVKEKIAKVNFDKSKTDLGKIEGAIVMAGYQANDQPADKNAYDKLEDCCKIGGH